MDQEVYNNAVRFLIDRIDYERIPAVAYCEDEYKLDRMREFLRHLGDPQNDVPLVHIAGTKGKGSTAAILSSICVAAGYKTGMFTSPHLDLLEERIAINGAACSAVELVDLVHAVRPVVEQMDAAGTISDSDDDFHQRGPTYFEITTALALLHFARCKADIAILEVGMGGRLDSTNVCTPICSVITSISFDHTKQLGNTLAQIAGEKAGIIKAGIPVVSGVTETESQRAISQSAGENKAPLVQAGEDFEFKYSQCRDASDAAITTSLDYFSHLYATRLDRMQLRLLGRHQAANAAVVLAVVDELAEQGWHFSADARRSGLKAAQCRARVELVQQQPAVIVDAAHNVASIDALLETIESIFVAGRRILIFATTQDKDIAGMLQRVLPRFEKVFFTRYFNNPRSVPPSALLQIAAHCTTDGRQPTARPQVCADPYEAWQTASQLADVDDLICVTGSFFIAAELRRLITAQANRLEPTSAAVEESLSATST
ncbi:MAG: folylpolyglutamate synthase/dihydrofolate synthase family protein [Pirellulales bacterium]